MYGSIYAKIQKAYEQSKVAKIRKNISMFCTNALAYFVRENLPDLWFDRIKADHEHAKLFFR